MGSLTTITVYNDALHVFQEDPAGFGKAVLDGINKANLLRVPVDVPFKSHANYIEVNPSLHADDRMVYVHSGNCVSRFGAWTPEFEKNLTAGRIDYLKKQARIIKDELKECERAIKLAETVNKKS